MKPKFVYVVDAGNRVKIGISSDPKRRMASMSSGSSEKLKLAFAVAVTNAREVEKACHRVLKPYRLNSEWFECGATFGHRVILAVAEGDMDEASRLSSEWGYYLAGYKAHMPEKDWMDRALSLYDAGLLSGPYHQAAIYLVGVRNARAEAAARQADKARTGAERCETL